MACYHKLYKSHSWLAQQTQAIDWHCFHMQLLTTTFLFTIIHGQHQWIQAETMVALASLALLSAKKLFQKGNFENKCVILTLSGADVCARSVGIDPYMYWGLYRFFPGHFLRQWNNHSVLRLRWRESMETPMFVSASQNTTLEKPLWCWHCISSAATASDQ